MSSAASKFHSPHPQTPSKCWYLAAVGNQYEVPVSGIFRQERHGDSVLKRPPRPGLSPPCAGAVRRHRVVPTPFPAWNPRVRHPPKTIYFLSKIWLHGGLPQVLTLNQPPTFRWCVWLSVDMRMDTKKIYLKMRFDYILIVY